MGEVHLYLSIIMSMISILNKASCKFIFKYKRAYFRFKHRLTTAKLTGFVDVVLESKNSSENPKIQTFQASVVIDESEKLVSEKLDGFWLLVTNHTERNSNGFKLSAPDAITPYREKVVIESVFRDIKSFIDIAPVYVWTEAHVKAHYTICVLAHLINRTIMISLHKNKGDKTSGIVTHEQLYKKVSACKIDRIEIENLNLFTYNLTRLNDEHKELINRLGLSKLLSNKFIEKIKSSSQKAIYV